MDVMQRLRPPPVEPRRRSWKQTALKLIAYLAAFILVVLSLSNILLNAMTSPSSFACYTPGCINAAVQILERVDMSVNPCEDFHQFACGTFIKDPNNIDGKDVFEMLTEEAKNVMTRLVIENDEYANLSQSPSFSAQKKFFRACIQEDEIDQNDARTFREDLRYVVGSTWPAGTAQEEWFVLMLRARERGMKYNFFLDIEIFPIKETKQVILKLIPPDVSSYTTIWSDPRRTVDLVTAAGFDWPDPGSDVNATAEFVKELAKEASKMRNEKQSTGFPYPTEFVNNFTSVIDFGNLDWVDFFGKLAGLNKTNVVICDQTTIKYLQRLDIMRGKYAKKVFSNYAAVTLLLEDCPLLAQDINEKCRTTTPNYTGDRYSYCLKKSFANFKHIAETHYAWEMITKEKHEGVLKLTEDMIEELKISIRYIHWLDSEERSRLVEKFSAMKICVGVCDPLYDPKTVEAVFGLAGLDTNGTIDILKLQHQINKKRTDREMEFLKRPYEDYLTAKYLEPVTNASIAYHRWNNTIVLSPALLTRPLYDPKWPEYMNYGALGTVVVQELVRIFIRATLYTLKLPAFDLHDKFQCGRVEYSRYASSNGFFVTETEESTKEVFVDFASVNLAYMAYLGWIKRFGPEPRLLGTQYSPTQLFWIMTARCQDLGVEHPLSPIAGSKTVNASRFALNDFRVTGPLMNSWLFVRDFRCLLESRMNPPTKCSMLPYHREEDIVEYNYL